MPGFVWRKERSLVVLLPGGSTPRSCWSAGRGWCSSRAVRSRMLLLIWASWRETLRLHVRRIEVDTGRREGLTSDEREEIRKLRRENFELRRANEILKSASVFFAKELDTDRTK